MSASRAGALLHHLHRLVESQHSDSQLLQRFIAHRDEAAFDALLNRHGRLVWNVCRHILHRDHDAEDAFQATFLVLARRAAAIRKGESLSCWLHGIAYRIAVRAKQMTAKRRARERHSAATVAVPPPDFAARELQAVLDEEVARLPEKLRAPFVLCCLEGRSRSEAAEELGWKVGTISSRIAQARQRLQTRLLRRGVTLSAALTAGVLADQSVSAALVQVTARVAMRIAAGQAVHGVVAPSVAALADAGMRTLVGIKTKLAITLLLAASFVSGVGLAFGPFNFTSPQREQGNDPVGLEGSTHPTEKTDQQGDPLPPEAIARLGTIRWRLDGHTADALAVSPDGKSLVAVNAANGTTVFDVATGKAVRRIPEKPELHKEWLGPQFWSVSALSANGRTAALIPNGGTIHLIDLATGEEARQKLKPGGIIQRAALSSDGRIFAVWIDHGLVQVWDVPTGKLLRELTTVRKQNSTWMPRWLALSADGKTLAWVGEDVACPIHVVDLVTGKEVRRLEEHDGSERQVCLSPNGEFLVASSGDGLVQLWDVKQGRILHKWTGRKNSIPLPYAFFALDGKKIVLYQPGDAIRLIEIATGKELWHVPRGTVSSVQDAYAIAPDGKTLYYSWGGGPVVYRYEMATGKRILVPGEMSEGFGDIAFAPKEEILYSVSDDGVLRAWETTTGKETRPLRAGTWGMLSPGGSLAVKGTREGFDLLDIATNEVRLHGEGWPRFSRDGRIVAAEGKNSIAILDTATGKQVSKLAGYPSFPSLHSFTPDGKRFAALCESGNGGVLRMWECATGQEVRSPPLPLCEVATLLFSPDGRMVVVGAPRGTPGLLVVETATGQQRQHIRFDKLLPAWTWPPTMFFSPDGEYLLIGDGANGVSIVDPFTSALLHRRQDHRGHVGRMVFSPSNRRLATSSGDGTALVWNADDFLRPARPKPVALARTDLEALWSDLAGADAAKAALAIRTLTQDPAQAVAWMRDHLPAAPAPPKPDPKRMDQLLKDLDSDEFEVRKRAEQEIETLAEAARPALEKTLSGQPSLDMRRAVERLLTKLESGGSPQQLQSIRAVEVLEHLAMPEARQLLQKLADGAPEARLTREAKAALERHQSPMNADEHR
jgi:RNA polymerase sigma factor (sigma-70 family)